MPLKMDKFTWGVVLVVLLLLVGAVVTVNLTGGQGWGQEEYLDEDTPAAAVHNAYVAFLKQDLETARQYYTNRVLDEAQNQEMLANRFRDPYYPGNRNQRLRIIDTELQGDDRALVTIATDYYSSSGPFGGGSTWSNRRTLELVREDGRWKIDTIEFFF